ncbi:MAG TPA: class I SAM-dependent methyltransferase [Gemmatimonadota bacterium]|nr:class I SAM-dependent methyltransferase [Gemmatimonadota bacterium]
MNVKEGLLTRFLYYDVRLANLALGSSAYSFTEHYGDQFRPLWDRYLAEFKGQENIQLLEIGSFEGRSALWFLRNILTHSTSSIICIDVFRNRMHELRFDHNMELSGLATKVTKIKARSQDTLKLMKNDIFNVVYIDGSHRAADVQADASLSWPLLKPGGVVILDDYLWKMEKPSEERPQMGIDNFLAKYGPDLDVLHKEYQVIVRKSK